MTEHRDRPTPDDPPRPGTPRRAVLRTAGVAALAGGGIAVLAACGADGGSTAAPTTSTTPSATETSASGSPSASATSATPSASAATPTATRTKKPSGPSIATAKVPVGSGVILDDADYVVTQPAKGTYKAFTKICTHQQCPVTEVDGADIVCKCHGSMFSIKDGSVTHSPATRPLKEFDTEVVSGKVYVTG